ncbi:nitrogen fixation protein NifX [Methyloprofundus sedimenti]|uniref:Nitrogen fixation protein NifX n=2 Tax=Methyloprofundus sedimenti TaxID=1420851 RepID=A0A1V8M1Q5_9GAMM|nr:nitrogen fixation protein NifX [Methyloprofundus sedimenti]
MSLTRRMQVVHSEQEELSMSTSLKVAFASTDMKHVNQHFGSAKSFAIYTLNPDKFEFLEAAQFGSLDQDGNEDKLAVKFDLLQGCAAVYCQAVGASAVKQLVALGIQPVKVNDDSPIEKLLDDLQSELRAGPSSWLARAIKQQSSDDPKRFNDMAEEDWQE